MRVRIWSYRDASWEAWMFWPHIISYSVCISWIHQVNRSIFPPLAAERSVDAESQCSCLKGRGRGHSSESSNSAVKSESDDKGSGREISKLSLSLCVKMSSSFGTVPRGFEESAGALAPISKIRQFPARKHWCVLWLWRFIVSWQHFLQRRLKELYLILLEK